MIRNFLTASAIAAAAFFAWAPVASACPQGTTCADVCKCREGGSCAGCNHKAGSHKAGEHKAGEHKAGSCGGAAAGGCGHKAEGSCGGAAAAAAAVPAAPAKAAGSCHGEGQAAAAAKPGIGELTVEALAELRKGTAVTVLDANSEQTRKKEGIIPGAVLLSSSSQYDAAKELAAPRDQKLVFYCANERCTASHKAAERAVSAGFSDVHVLPAGIVGWKKAGQPTAEVPRS